MNARVLINGCCDDDNELISLEMRMAGHRASPRVERTLEGMTIALADGDWDLIVVDADGGRDRTLRAAKVARIWAPDVPTVVVGSEFDDAMIVEVVRAGAVDCVNKDALNRLPEILRRERSVDAPRRSEAPPGLREMIDAAPNALVLLDADARIVMANPRVESIVGADLARFIADNVRPAIDGDHADWIAVDGDDCLAHTFETTTETGPVEVGIRQVKVANETMAVVAVRDISEQVRIRTELEVSVRRRTEELREALDLADRANQAKSDFLARVSHEIRTPLNSILGYSQLLNSSSALGSKETTAVEAILRSGNHLLDLINDVLEVSKIEAGQAVVTLRAFELRGLADDVKTITEPSAIDKGLSLSVVVEAGPLVWIETDHAKLRHALVNLVGNAIKFTNNGGVALRFDLVGTDDAPRLRVEVEDTGPGIAPEEMESIFVLWCQGGLGRESPRGTGLGLALSRQQMRLLDGDLTVESEVGRGSTFTLEIPVRRALPHRVPQRGGGSRRLAPGQPARKVLIVDDSTMERMILLELLAMVGFEVWEASTGEYACEIAAEIEPDIILMDLRMPTMNGYETTRRIREFLPPCFILAVSASAFESDRIRAMEAGADGFIRKPFQHSDILDVIAAGTGLRYRRDDRRKPADSITRLDAPTVEELRAQRVSSLPANEVENLLRASLSCDLEEVCEIAARVSETDRALGSALESMARRFQFGRIVDLLEDAEPKLPGVFARDTPS